MRAHAMFFYLLAVALIGVMALIPAVGVLEGKIEYKDLVSLQLTALTVVLAVLGIGVAALAVWGYKEFMDQAKATAQGVAASAVSAHLGSDLFKLEVRAVLVELERDRAAAAAETVKGDAPPQPAGEPRAAKPFPPTPDPGETPAG